MVRDGLNGVNCKFIYLFAKLSFEERRIRFFVKTHFSSLCSFPNTFFQAFKCVKLVNITKQKVQYLIKI